MPMEETTIEESTRLFTEMLHTPEARRQAMIDTGVFNGIIKGYAVIAARNAGLDREQTKQLMAGLNWAFSECTAADAIKAYEGY